MGTMRPPHHAFPWRRVLSVVIVMVIGVAMLWTLIQQVVDTDIPVDEPTAALSSPAASPADIPITETPVASATPRATNESEWPVGSLPAMLELAPDRLSDGSLPLNDVVRYADIATWMAACGIVTPTSLADPALAAWEAELDNLAIPTSLRERGLDPAWRQIYGFDLTQVAQVLIVGQAPDYVMILRGSFSAAELQQAWVTSGYQAVEVEGRTTWTLSPGDTIDLSDPESRLAMGTLNNIVLLDDGTLIAAARISRLGSVLQVVNGDAPSLAKHDDVTPLLTPETGVEGLVSAVISKGSLLQGTISSMPLPAATPGLHGLEPAIPGTPVPPDIMPQADLVLIGIPVTNAMSQATPHADPQTLPTISMLVVFDSHADALLAEAGIRKRLVGGQSPITGRPYDDRLGNPIVAAADEERQGLVLIEARLMHGSADWLVMLSDRDLGFTFWLPEE